MVSQVLELILFCSLITYIEGCQPAPTMIQRAQAIADSPTINSARLINVEPSQIPNPSPLENVFQLLKIPFPSTTVSTLTTENSTEIETNNSTISDSTNSTDNLAQDLALAERSILKELNDTDKLVKPTFKLFAVTSESKKKECDNAIITAITTIPYDDRLIGMDLDRIHQQIKLLEAYTQRTLSSFGEYSEEVTSIESRFAIRFNIQKTASCSELRTFATKAVSYSREIEKIQYTCHCDPMWIIAKRKAQSDKNF